MSNMVVRPLRFTNNVKEMQGFLEAIGLRPRIESLEGNWVDMVAGGGMVALHSAETSVTGAKPGQTSLSFEAADLTGRETARGSRARRRRRLRRGLWPGADLPGPARRRDPRRRSQRRPLRLPGAPTGADVITAGLPGTVHRPARALLRFPPSPWPGQTWGAE